MKKSVLLLFLAASLFIQTASATIITRDFNVDFVEGDLSGKTFVGTLSYDDSELVGSGFEPLTPNGTLFPSFKKGFLSFSLEIDGVQFEIGDDTDYPNFPLISFEDGVLVYVEYISAGSNHSLSAVASHPESTLDGVSKLWFFTNGEDESVGIGSLEPFTVPDRGASVLFLSLSLSGIFVVHRRRG